MNLNELKTPCFIINKCRLDSNFKHFKKALDKYFTKNILSYSVKTNSLPYILNIAKLNNIFAEVVSFDEYNLAKYIGYNTSNIIYNGPLKDKKTFIDAVNGGAYVNIENFRELSWLKETNKNANRNIGLRLNINLERINGETDKNAISRFGFSYENGEFQTAIKELKELGITSVGIHAHRKTQSRSLECYSKICKYIKEIIYKNNIDIKYIDIGGGFFGNLENKPTYEDYTRTIYNELIDIIKDFNPTIIIEPGSSVIAYPVDYLFTIIDKKELNNRIICQSDGTRIDIDPLFNKKDYFKEYIPINNLSKEVPLQEITGTTCLENDILFEIRNQKELNIGDKFLINRIGAYTLTLSANFINLQPNVYVLDNNKYFLVRKKWTVENWIQENNW